MKFMNFTASFHMNLFIPYVLVSQCEDPDAFVVLPHPHSSIHPDL